LPQLCQVPVLQVLFNTKSSANVKGRAVLAGVVCGRQERLHRRVNDGTRRKQNARAIRGRG
jgi:hypothetical protein